MLQKIRLFFDYNSFPVWLYDENDMIIDNCLPQEWEGDEDLTRELWAISDMYDQLFIDNEKEFTYRGFKNPSEREAFGERVAHVKEMLEKKNGGKYPIEYDLEVEL